MTTTHTHGLPSPAPSTPPMSLLPTPRAHPLKPSSAKEIQLLNYVDARISTIHRRYMLKYLPAIPGRAAGYTTLAEIAHDIDQLLNVVWTSGTPGLQIPYLLTLAGIVVSCVPDFGFDTVLFAVVARLDEAFARLVEADRLSGTEKVRVRSLVEDTRVVALNKAEESGLVVEEWSDDEGEDEDVPALLARMYERTLALLGGVLGGLPVLQDDVLEDAVENLRINTKEHENEIVMQEDERPEIIDL